MSRARGFANLRPVTAGMNDFDPGRLLDPTVPGEMGSAARLHRRHHAEGRHDPAALAPFFLATAWLFGTRNGEAGFVSHYRLQPR
jgi:hypothetical protein